MYHSPYTLCIPLYIQLISNPAILFLDEPTSGLDSFQSLSVMESMKSMAQSGRLVISVIHQPRSSIYDMFDKLLLLSNGRTMYYGDANQASQYFAENGHKCPKLFNPSDYFLDILSPDNRTPELDKLSAERISLLGDAWEAHLNTTVVVADVAGGVLPVLNEPFTGTDTGTRSNPMEKHSDNIFKYDFVRLYRNFKLLSWRSWSESIRNTQVIVAKVLLTRYVVCCMMVYKA